MGGSEGREGRGGGHGFVMVMARVEGAGFGVMFFGEKCEVNVVLCEGLLIMSHI